MRILVGTSGFSYPAWKGSFYPAGVAASGMLAHYATRLSAVEVNNTFYRMPQPRVLAAWRAEVPGSFVFALKAPRSITHLRRLVDADDATSAFFGAATELGRSLGPALFQLPPNARRDLPRLREFLSTLPPDRRVAFEFRDDSWLTDEVATALADHGAALVVNQSEDRDPPVVPTARHGYLRLRRASYDQRELSEWADRIRAQPWDEACVFFKHEDEARGPRFAIALRELLGDGDGDRAEQGHA